MFFSDSSRPCSACSVALLTASRSLALPCAEAVSNIVIRASGSKAFLVAMGFLGREWVSGPMLAPSARRGKPAPAAPPR